MPLRHFHRAFMPSFLFCASLAVAALVAGLWPATAGAVPLQMNFDGGPQIVDGGIGDLDGLVNGKIDFSGIYGLAGYQVQGTLRETPPFPPGASMSLQFSPPIYALTLTNFSAEALGSSTLNMPLYMRFDSDPFAGAFSPGSGIGVITAFVGNSLSNPVPANTDTLVDFFSFIDDNATNTVLGPPFGAPLPQGNPFHPGPGTTAYATTGIGITPTPALLNPSIHSLIELQLGQVGDQFLMPSSAEIGFTAVPEPSAAALFALGLLSLAIGLFRRRAVR